MENVFIAWSGNYSLACAVATQLESHGYQAIVGGGSPKDMFVGKQIQAQMNSATYAIILAQKKDMEGIAEFSDNVMFEWGYLISRLTSKKVYVYLIDTDERELPSDLVGSWVTLVTKNGRSDDEIAEEIVGQFETEIIVLDKLEIMSQWKEVKALIVSLGKSRQLGDHEAAQYVLFSVLTAYYYDEVNSLLNAIYRIAAQSETMKAVTQASTAILSIFDNTANLAKPLEIGDYFEITSMLDQDVENSLEKSDLKDWLKILRYQALNLANTVGMKFALDILFKYIRLSSALLRLLISKLLFET